MAERTLEMKFAGALVKHLGLQMYSGAVPALAELIANSWDADATNVAVTLPLDEAISQELEIAVTDDGGGMSFPEVNEKYLMLGRDRRTADGQYSPGGRHVLGRKGIGKLAGFGIARLVEVWTVKDGYLTAFRMDYDKITGPLSTIEPYQPEVIADRAVTSDDPISGGTRVLLKRLQLRNKVNGDRFRRSMGRRFSILSPTFRVTVNGEPLASEGIDLQFRFPEKGWNSDEVDGLGSVRWWAGFTPTPIKLEESRGIAVLARGKLAQAPFFFELAGGAASQLGLQYLTGELIADGLDAEGEDLIATDRASVLWEHPTAKPLLEWGQAKTRDLLRRWSQGRRDSQFKRLRDTTQYMDMVAKFPERERGELLAAIETLAKIPTIENERLDEIVKILIQAYENDHFLDVIRALRDIENDAQDEVVRLIREWDVIEAVQTAQLVRGRVEIIRTFGDMIDRQASEKPDMQDFLKAHPWLLDPAWTTLEHERSLEKVLDKHFNETGKKKKGKQRDQRRVDFLCLGDSTQAVVVEVKRPGTKIGVVELRQLEDYLLFLNGWNKESTDGRSWRAQITGVLIYSAMDGDGEQLAESMRQRGQVRIVSWDGLLETAERLHREYLDLMTRRAPSDDPRIIALSDLNNETDEDDTTEEG